MNAIHILWHIGFYASSRKEQLAKDASGLGLILRLRLREQNS
jgi:hypothetical protein